MTVLGAVFLRGIGIVGRDVQEYEEKPFGANMAAAREEPFGAGIASANDKQLGGGIAVPSELKPFSFAMRIGSSVPSTPDTPTFVDDERSLRSHELVQQPPSTLRSIVIILTCTLAMMHTVSVFFLFVRSSCSPL